MQRGYAWRWKWGDAFAGVRAKKTVCSEAYRTIALLALEEARTGSIGCSSPAGPIYG